MKRRSKDEPCSWLESESLVNILSPRKRRSSIDTTVASSFDKSLFLSRFEKEIIQEFQFALCNDKRGNMEKQLPGKPSRLVRERFLFGTNECTRALEAALLSKGSIPLLVVLARDIYPATVLTHVPVLAEQIRDGVPILLLPGQASTELGKLLGVKRVSIMLFLESDETTVSGDEDSNERVINDKVDSFVNFIRQKMPVKN